MQSTVVEEKGLQRKVNIIVEASEVRLAFTNFYGKIQKTAAIKGFRKGKAPIPTLKALYREQATQEVLRGLLSEFYHKALEEYSFHPISQPTLDFKNLQEDKGFEFSAEFEIKPEVKLTRYEGLAVEKEKAKVKDKDVKDFLIKLSQDRSDLKPVLEDRSVKDGDIVKLNFEGFLDGVPFEGGKSDNHELQVGSQSFIEGFEEGLIGMKVKDKKDLNLNFPKEYHEAKLSGKEVVFKVEILALMKKTLPELNDSWAQSLGPYKTLSELEDAIKKDMIKREEERVAEDLNSKILKSLVDMNPVEVPDQLHREQKKQLIEKEKENLKSRNLPEDKISEYIKKWDDTLDKSSKFMIQSTFLIEALAQKYKLFAGPEDINKKIKKHSEQSGLPLEQIQKLYKEDENKRSNLGFQVTQEKVIDFLLSKAVLTEVSSAK